MASIAEAYLQLQRDFAKLQQAHVELDSAYRHLRAEYHALLDTQKENVPPDEPAQMQKRGQESERKVLLGAWIEPHPRRDTAPRCAPPATSVTTAGVKKCESIFADEYDSGRFQDAPDCCTSTSTGMARQGRIEGYVAEQREYVSEAADKSAPSETRAEEDECEDGVAMLADTLMAIHLGTGGSHDLTHVSDSMSLAACGQSTPENHNL